jgi:hypothetical protein
LPAATDGGVILQQLGKIARAARQKIEIALIRPRYRWIERFSALGESCEFGMVQRRRGAEPLDLFRFSLTRPGPLTSALGEGLRDLYHPEKVDVRLTPRVQGPPVYCVYAPSYDLQFYASESGGHPDLEAFMTAERRRLAFLTRKFMEDCEDGAKIFVFTARSAAAEEAAPLRDALRRHGPATLLWVSASPEKAGAVEAAGEGLLFGFVDRLAPVEQANDVALEAWKRVCLGAVGLWEQHGRFGGRHDE